MIYQCFWVIKIFNKHQLPSDGHVDTVFSWLQRQHLLNYLVRYIAIICKDPGTPQNGSRNGSEDFSYKSKLSFQCNKGFILFGSYERSCDEDGKWTGVQPYCIGNPLHLISLFKWYLLSYCSCLCYPSQNFNPTWHYTLKYWHNKVSHMACPITYLKSPLLLPWIDCLLLHTIINFCCCPSMFITSGLHLM